jgi:hypothetical protein
VTPRPGDFPLAVVRDLLDWWRANGARGAIIGGVAAAVQGNPRFTKDLDATIVTDESRLDELLSSASNFGFSLRDPDPARMARVARMVLLYHETAQLGVDVSLAGPQVELDAVDMADSIEIEGMVIPIAPAATLVVMKGLAAREQDLRDIEAILDAHPEIDIELALEQVRVLAELAEKPESFERFRATVARSHRREKR